MDPMSKMADAVHSTAKSVMALNERCKSLEADQEEHRTGISTQIKDLQEAANAHGKALGSVAGPGGDVGDCAITRADPAYYSPIRGRTLPNAKAALAWGHYMRVVIRQDERSRAWLSDVGIEVKRVEELEERAGSIHDEELGGIALPDELGQTLIPALASYGVAARECDVVPMRGPRIRFVKDVSDIRLYPLEEHGEVPEVDKNLGMVTLDAKLWGAFTRWSDDLEASGLVNSGESWASRFARAIAKKIDECLFKGDGTSAFSNMVGILNHANIPLVSLPGGKTAFTDATYDDVINLFAAVNDDVYAEGNSKLYLSGNMTWLLKQVKDGQGRPIFTDAREGGVSQIVGEDTVRTAMMPRMSDTAAGKKFMVFGDLRRAYKLGIQTQMSLLFSPHAFFQNAQNALRVLTRFGVAAAYPEALATLKTADA